MDPAPKRARRISDLLGWGAAALTLFWSVAATLSLGPIFTRMYEEVGGEIPIWTQICLTPMFSILGGSIPAAVMIWSVAAKVNEKQRLMAASAAVVLMFLLPALFLVGMYLPLFRMSSAVAP
jgi:hypothetical protein